MNRLAAISLCFVALGCGLTPRAARAQHGGHTMSMPGMAMPTPPKKAAAPKPAVKKPAVSKTERKDPAPRKPTPGEAAPAADHAGMDMSRTDSSGTEMPGIPRTPIPRLDDSARQAAFPPVADHAAHDPKQRVYWLVDRLEMADASTSGAWSARAWIGGDVDRVWLRSEGEAIRGNGGSGSVEVFYGHATSPWWDLVAGLRQDFGRGPPRTWLAVGTQGLSPYKLAIEATAYLGEESRTAARFEIEYDSLLTNRVILQWRGEANLYGRDDRLRTLGSGLSTVEAGVRLRYEVTRSFAPYFGIEWERAFGGTADFRRADGDPTRDTRLVAGVRFWF